MVDPETVDGPGDPSGHGGVRSPRDVGSSCAHRRTRSRRRTSGTEVLAERQNARRWRCASSTSCTRSGTELSARIARRPPPRCRVRTTPRRAPVQRLVGGRSDSATRSRCDSTSASTRTRIVTGGIATSPSRSPTVAAGAAGAVPSMSVRSGRRRGRWSVARRRGHGRSGRPARAPRSGPAACLGMSRVDVEQVGCSLASPLRSTSHHEGFGAGRRRTCGSARCRRRAPCPAPRPLRPGDRRLVAAEVGIDVARVDDVVAVGAPVAVQDRRQVQVARRRGRCRWSSDSPRRSTPSRVSCVDAAAADRW